MGSGMDELKDAWAKFKRDTKKSRNEVKKEWAGVKNIAKAFGWTEKAPEKIKKETNHEYSLKLRYVPDGQAYYDIQDTQNKSRYMVKEGFWASKHHLTIYEGKKKLGEIKKQYVAAPVIDSEDLTVRRHHRHVCSVFLNGVEVNRVEAYKHAKQQCFEVANGNWSVSYSVECDTFSLKSGENHAKLYEASSNKAVLGYNNAEKELELMLISVCLSHINRIILQK